MYNCNICKKSFSRGSTYENHQLKDHDMKATFRCPICKYLSPSWRSATQHLNTCRKSQSHSIHPPQTNEVSEFSELGNENVDENILSDQEHEPVIVQKLDGIFVFKF